MDTFTLPSLPDVTFKVVRRFTHSNSGIEVVIGLSLDGKLKTMQRIIDVHFTSKSA